MKSSEALSSLRSFLDQQGGLYQAQATPGRLSPVSSAANSWHQVKGTKPARLEGELHLPPFHLWTIILELWALNGH